uniref:Uncharacterized protein n=1 Tax=Sphaerodactylus townsendi TaxID=933632 RepID=A0ACB8EDR3_9SAUR
MLAASLAGQPSAESRFPLHAFVWHDQPALLEQALDSGQFACKQLKLESAASQERINPILDLASLLRG